MDGTVLLITNPFAQPSAAKAANAIGEKVVMVYLLINELDTKKRYLLCV